MARRIVYETKGGNSVNVPCLARQSDQDFYPVELGRYIAETAQQGSLHIFEGCGHSVQLQNYEVFNKVLSSFIPT